ALQAATETMRPGRAWRRARLLAALLGRWRRGAAAAAIGLVGRTGDFFGSAWRVARTEGPLGVVRHSWQFFVTQGFSSLTRRIVFLNVFGLVALVVAIVPLNQARTGLIEASERSLLVQGETRARAIAGAATAENGAAGPR